MIDALNKLLAPLRTRVANMVSRAVVQIVDDSLKMQVLQLGLLDEETREGIERFQNYGFTSVPQAGAEAAVIFVGGRRDHGLAIAVDDRRYRLKGLVDGEVAVYTDQGDSIVIKRGGTIEVTASTKVKLITPIVELAGNGNPVAKGDTLNSAIQTYGTSLATALTTGITGAALPSPGAAGALTTLASAIAAAASAFNASATAALSTKVKLG